MKRRYLLAFLLYPCCLLAEHGVPTVNDQGTLPPAVAGEVAEVIGNMLVVRRADSEISVLTDKNTHFFTFYGGVIYLHEICPESAVEIWFQKPGANPRITPAASIRVPATC